MKIVLSLLFVSMAFMMPFPVHAQFVGTESTEETEAILSGGSSVTGPASYAGGTYGADFKSELTFVTNFLESQYILFLSLLVGIFGFWQFFVQQNNFGLVMIVMAMGLTAFPGIYKGFYAGTRPFVHEAAGTGETQGWQ